MLVHHGVHQGAPLQWQRVDDADVDSSRLESRLRDHAVAMDAVDLFRKLGAGAKFDLKRFGKDAQRFKVIARLFTGLLNDDSH